MVFFNKALLSVLLGLLVSPVFPSCPTEHSKLILIKGIKQNDSTGKGLSTELFKNLKPRALELGYCLALNNWSDIQEAAFLNSDKILALKYDSQLTSESDSVNTYSYKIIAGIVGASKGSKQKMKKEGFSHPLAELELKATPSAINILAEKIIENLREQYVCHFAVESEPPKVNFSLKNGYRGATPMELVIPLGEIQISSEEKGYLPYQKTISLEVPGYHKHIIKLKKRHFYHSKAMYPLAGFILASLGSYYLQEYYYSQYSQLNKSDYENNPEKFSELFHKAQFWERSWMSAAGLSLLTLGVSFVF